MAHEEDRFRDLLRRQVRAASEEALRADGAVSPEQLSRLESLARLVEIAEAARPPALRKRWPLAAALGSTLLVVSMLLFARVRETEIELDLAVQEAGFVLPTQQVLTEVMNLSALGASGLQGVHLPPSPGESALALAEDSGSVPSVHLAVATVGERQGAISMAALALPASTRVWLRHTQAPHQYRLSLKGNALTLRVDVRGPVRFALYGAPLEQRDFASPRPVLLQAAPGLVDIDLTLADLSHAAFVPQLLASDLFFSRIDEFHAEDQTLVRRLSTILSGTVYFEALNGLAYQLRPGAALGFERIEGLIRTLELREDQIVVKFRGRVRGMRTGWGGAQRSLMPTYIEWLKARHGLYLLWGTTLYLFGLIASLLRWWGLRL